MDGATLSAPYLDAIPLRHNAQLDRFLAHVGPVDYVIANGDYAVNTAPAGSAMRA